MRAVPIGVKECIYTGKIYMCFCSVHTEYAVGINAFSRRYRVRQCDERDALKLSTADIVIRKSPRNIRGLDYTSR